MNKDIAAHHPSRFPRILLNASLTFLVLIFYMKAPSQKFTLALAAVCFCCVLADILRLALPFLKDFINNKAARLFILKGELNQISSLSLWFLTVTALSFFLTKKALILSLAFYMILPSMIFASDYFLQKRRHLGAYGLLSGYLGACLISLAFYVRWNVMGGRLFLAVLLTALLFLFSFLVGSKRLYGASLSLLTCCGFVWSLFYFFGQID